jgi:hypothetical protein
MMISVTALSQDREDLRYKERHLVAGLLKNRQQTSAGEALGFT